MVLKTALFPFWKYLLFKKSKLIDHFRSVVSDASKRWPSSIWRSAYQRKKNLAKKNKPQNYSFQQVLWYQKSLSYSQKNIRWSQVSNLPPCQWNLCLPTSESLGRAGACLVKHPRGQGANRIDFWDPYFSLHPMAWYMSICIFFLWYKGVWWCHMCVCNMIEHLRFDKITIKKFREAKIPFDPFHRMSGSPEQIKVSSSTPLRTTTSNSTCDICWYVL